MDLVSEILHMITQLFLENEDREEIIFILY